MMGILMHFSSTENYGTLCVPVAACRHLCHSNSVFPSTSSSSDPMTRCPHEVTQHVRLHRPPGPQRSVAHIESAGSAPATLEEPLVALVSGLPDVCQWQATSGNKSQVEYVVSPDKTCMRRKQRMRCPRDCLWDSAQVWYSHLVQWSRCVGHNHNLRLVKGHDLSLGHQLGVSRACKHTFRCALSCENNSTQTYAMYASHPHRFFGRLWPMVYGFLWLCTALYGSLGSLWLSCFLMFSAVKELPLQQLHLWELWDPAQRGQFSSGWCSWALYLGSNNPEN